MAGRKLEVQIVGDSKSLERAFGRAADSSSSFGSKLAKVGKVAGVAFAAGVGLAAVATVSFAKAALDAEKSQARLDAAFKHANASAKDRATAMKAVNDISVKSGLDDEDLADSLAKLTQVTGSASKATADMAIAADLARAKGISLEAATGIVTKAALGNVGALKRQGIEIPKVTAAQDALKESHTKATVEQVKAAKAADDLATRQGALAALQKKFGGDAEAYGKTASGAMDRFKVAVENVQEGLGAALLPVLARVAGGAAEFLDRFNQAQGAGAKFRVVMDEIKAVSTQAWAALKAINWGAVWDGLINGVRQLSPQLASALSTLGTTAKTAFDGLSSSWGQFIAASVAGAAVFAQAASRVVKAIEAIRLGMLTLNPLFTALTILAGLTAGALYKIVTSGNEVSAALKKAESALNSLKGAAEGAKGAEQNLAEAKNRLRQATLNVTAAIKLKQDAVDKEGKSSQAAKQAEANVEAAYLGRRRAAMDVTSATQALDAAQTKSKKTTDTVKSSVRDLQKEYDGLIAKGPPLQSAVGRIGVDQDKLNAGFERQSAKKYAADMTSLATEAGKTAKELQKTNPALAAIAKGVETAAKSQAKLALEMGKIPGSVKKLEGPGKTAGMSVGGAIGDGMKIGIASKAAAVATAARGLVTAAHTAAQAAAQVKSPSKLFAIIGEMMGEGIGVGFSRRTASVAATISGKTKSLVDASIAEVTRLQGVLDGINNQRAAQDRARAVTDAAAALAEAKKKGEGVLAAERELARARQDIVVAGLESQLAKEQGVQARREAALQAAQQRFQAIYDAAMSRYQSAVDKVADYVSRSFQAKTDAMVAAVGAKWDKLITAAQKAGAKLTDQEKALAEFDQQSAPMTDSEKAIAALDAAEAERGRNAAATAAQTALANAQQITDAQQKAEAITAAEEQMRVAQLAITRAGLEAQAVTERVARDAALAEKRVSMAKDAEDSRIQRDKDTAELVAKLEGDKTKEITNLTERRNQRLTKLQEQFKDLQTWLGKHPKEYDKINEKVKKIMDAFGVDMKSSGEELGNAFAKGLRASIGEVTKAARAVAQAAANNIKLNSPAKEGPMADLDRWWSALPSTLLSGLNMRPVTSALSSAVGMPVMAPGGAAMTAAGGGGATTIVVNMPNYVGDKREITQMLRTELKRAVLRNA